MKTADLQQVIQNLKILQQQIVRLHLYKTPALLRDLNGLDFYLQSSLHLLNQHLQQAQDLESNRLKTQKLISTLALDKKSLQHQLQDLQGQLNQFRAQPSSKGQLAQLQARLDEMLVERNALISTLSKYQSSSDLIRSKDRPQHHILVPQFRQFEEQDLHFVALLLYRHLSDRKQWLPLNRRRDFSKIKAILAQETLMQFSHAYHKTEAQNTAIANLQNIFEIEHSSELTAKLTALVSRSFELSNQIQVADPPGTLWIADPDQMFDAERHQVSLGCVEHGVISFTIYPGYQVHDRLYEKALVFTSSIVR